MRSRDEVMERFVEVRDVKLRERKTAYLCRAAINCSFNVRMRLKGRGQVGFCNNPAILARTKNAMFVCNDEETARRCRMFSCRNTEESVERDFMEVLQSPSRCGDEYPKLAMLIWFLQGADGGGRMSRLGVLVRQAASSVWRIVTFRWMR